MNNTSNNRIFFLTIGIFLMIILIVWIIILSRPDTVVVSDPAQPSETLVDTGVQGITQIQQNNVTSEFLLVNTKFGEPLRVNNFLQGGQVEQYDDSTFLVTEESTTEEVLYQIFFHRGGGIGISLQGSDLSFSRGRAEAALKDLLQVSTLELCALEVSMTVPNFVSQQLNIDYSGVDLGISDCPSHIPLNEF